MTIQILKMLHFQNEFQLFKRILKRITKTFLVHSCTRIPSQLAFRPSHSINPPGGTATVSSAAAGPARAIGPVMPSITLMNTTVQQCINKTCKSTC